MLLRYSLLLFLALAGCGYHLAGETPIVLPGEVQSLAIRNVTNPTTETWIVPRLRSELRNEITRRSDVVWKEVRLSEAILDVDILRYTTSSSLKGEDEQTLKSDAIISIEGRLLRNEDKSLIWSSGPITASESFAAGGGEREAGEDALEKAVRRLADRLDQNF
ncbi:MAG: LPS assembly lipoprotein LptE [Desulfovibrionales bacterium]